MKVVSIVAMFWVSLTLVACSSGGSMGNNNPPPSTFTIGGTVTGLSGTGLVLQNNGGDNLAITADGTFTFKTAVTSGANYKVSVLTQPSTPAQTCVVTAGTGTASANITSVVVTCTTVTYTIGGTVTGLAGTGLVLQNNGGNNLAIPANGAFTFSTAVTSGAAYAVTVMTQPAGPAQTCVVTSGSGTATANVTNVVVTCSTITYTIGGTVAGLAGTGLVLQDNGGDNRAINANGAFTFTSSVASGAAYAVTVLAQPTNLWQTCLVTGGGGTATANVTTVQVTCTTNTYKIGGTVTGLLISGLVLQDNNGDNLTVNTNPDFSQSFTFANSIASGSTYSVTIQTQPAGQTCWLGTANGSNTGTVQGTAITNVQVGCSKLWVYESGPEIVNQNGHYGTIGLYGPGNVPGGRYSGSSWTDTNGNYWLFGGFGYDSGSPSPGNLNDLWEYSPTPGPNQWRWVGGSIARNQKGMYSGTEWPGGRDGAATWVDSSGNFWLFGGFGYDSGTSTAGELNDLWEYNPTTGIWTWVSGSDLVNQAGVYGTMGTGAPGNVPGARDSGVSWIDKSGNLWLFGGTDTTGASPVYYNDLWEYNPGTGYWAWISGSNTTGAQGTYGTLGIGAPANVPGARELAVSWSDASGNMWLFGGYGQDSVPDTAKLNDLWEYNPTTGYWTWMSGSHLSAQPGVYGLLGTAAAGNVPGARQGPTGWTDVNGDFWLFGGLGFDSSNPAPGELNDLWKYSVSTGQWAWMGGSQSSGAIGVYGAAGMPDPTAAPGARGGASGWIDTSGNLWLFGGNGPASGVNGSFDDLWLFQP